MVKPYLVLLLGNIPYLFYPYLEPGILTLTLVDYLNFWYLIKKNEKQMPHYQNSSLQNLIGKSSNEAEYILI